MNRKRVMMVASAALTLAAGLALDARAQTNAVIADYVQATWPTATNVLLGRTGVGTNAPGAQLHVFGNARVDGGLDVTGAMRTAQQGDLTMGGFTNGVSDLGVASSNVALRGNWISYDGTPTGIYVATNGYVGVGTNAPSAPLHVNGNAVVTGIIYGTATNAQALGGNAAAYFYPASNPNSWVAANVTNGLASTAWVAGQGYVTQAVTNGLAQAASVPSTNGLASTAWVAGQGYVTQGVTNGLPSLSGNQTWPGNNTFSQTINGTSANSVTLGGNAATYFYPASNPSNWTPRLTSNVTVSITASMTGAEIQALIDQYSGNLGGYTVIHSFAAGNYNLSSLSIRNSYNGVVQLSGPNAGGGPYTNQTAKLFVTNGISVVNSQCQVQFYDLAVTGPTNTTLLVANSGFLWVYDSWFYSTTTASGVGVSANYGVFGLVYVAGCSFSNIRTGVEALNGSRLQAGNNGRSGTSPAYGHYAWWGGTITRTDTNVVGTTDNAKWAGGQISLSTNGGTWF